MVIFAVDATNGALRFLRQRATNSLDWLEWSGLGGKVEPPLAVGQNADGRLEVFARDAISHVIKHIWQTNSHDDWSTWSEIAGLAVMEITVERNKDGRLELFGTDASNKTLVHCWQHRADVSDDWSKWESLGGTIHPGFAAGKNTAGQLEVFAVNGTNGAVNRIIQSKAGDSGSWSSWGDFEGNVKAGLALGRSGDGRLEVLAVDATNSMLLHRWETLVDASDKWSAWAPLGALAQPYPAVMANEDGDLEVFALDVENGKVINHRRQISAASDWLDWSSLDRPTFQYASRTWHIDEGLPDNLVQSIAQTSDGYLWVGTRSGLARFDGVEFTSYDSKNTPALKNSSITALCADRYGVLWIGTDGGGLVRLKEGVFSRFTTTNGLAGDHVRVISESKDSSLWVGTTSGISNYKEGHFRTYKVADGLLSDAVNYIYEDRDGSIWMATGKGLNRLRQGTMDKFIMPNGLPDDSVRGICQDKGGRVWIGSNNGLLWYDFFWQNHFYAYNTRYGLSDTFVSAICEDHEGNLWVGTYSGLNRFRGGRFYNQLDNEGLPFDRVNALFEDREGDLWVGSKEGLIRLTPKRFFAYTRQQGLTHNNTMSVLEDHTGSLWIGTWGGGVNQLKDEQVVAYAPTNGLSQDLILSLCAGRDGSIWAGADFDGGLMRLKAGKIVRYTAKDGLIDGGLRVLCEDRSGNLWIGTSRGLSCFSGGKFSNDTRDGVRAICEDHAGALWFGTENGLECKQNDKWTQFTTADGLSDNTVTAVYEDKNNVLWVGTANGGLNRWRNNQFTSYTTRQGLFSDEIFSIVEDDEGWLWMSCSKGVFRVRKQDFDDYDDHRAKSLASIAYGKSDGMESPQCNGAGKPAAWKSEDGRLWFPTSKGIVAVNPKTTRIDRQRPPVFVEQLIADKKAQSPLSGAPAGAAIHIPPGRGELEFKYTALSLSAPEKDRFKYKLEPIDSDWVDAGSRRTAYYNNVSPGRYRFRVIACNKDSIWNDTGASLAFVFEPHYWQTWWFRGFMVVLVVGGASGVVLYATRRKMQRKLQLLEQRHAIEKERGRIAKDIHDDLGSSLTRIMMLGERVEEGLGRREDVGGHINKIVSSARHTVQSLDEIVWAVNPENDTLNGLLEYIGHYANEFFENTRMSCRLELPVELPEFSLAAETRHNLFLVVKEALHNALKHSGATEVRVEVAVKEVTLQILVEDNGHGFELNALAGGRVGNGLRNMRKRMEQLGGHIEIASTPGKGTSLKFVLKLKFDSPHAVA
jgi:ligand-binding sensor domain-containing protein/signal transduction histidine kinase